jgi:tetratricopeptide (TPR) repeat protein
MSSPVTEFERDVNARLARGDWPGASAAAAAFRSSFPSIPAGWLYGSIIALHLQDRQTALAQIEQSLVLDATSAQCLLQKAEVLLALGRRAEALAAAAAASAGSSEVAALDALGEFLVGAREHQQALAVYDRALAIEPGSATLLSKRGTLRRFVGEFDAAAGDYRAVLAIAPGDAEALQALAELARQSPQSNYIAEMQTALAAAPSRSPEAALLHFGLAKSYEDLGDYRLSWRHLSEGNALERERIKYDGEIDRAVIEQLLAGFAAEESTAAAASGDSPIFIVGLPRTGTTLVERIIGRHSQVHSAGELSALSEAIGDCMRGVAGMRPRSWVEFAAMLPQLDASALARAYLERARPLSGERQRFTDKQPMNFMYCALILRALPQARIVHLRRHPMAACYAIYKARFQRAFPFAYDLADLGSFYLGYHRLMAHWHRVLPGRILDVAYEEVVTALEPTTRRLLAYLGLPFEEACLEFHLNPDATMTASAVQVRQPLYDSSLEQWRYFATELAPLRARLAAAGIQVD